MSRSALMGTALILLGFGGLPNAQATFYYYAGTGHYYTVTDTTMSWTDADALATSMGGYLVSVLSQGENDFLQATFFPTQAEAFWIGLHRTAPNAPTFVWSSGESVGYTNWGPGEPNNSHSGIIGPDGEPYTVINWQIANGASRSRGQWNDVPNNGTNWGGSQPQPYRAIIELDPLPVPEPSSLALLAFGALGLASYLRRSHVAKSSTPRA